MAPCLLVFLLAAFLFFYRLGERSLGSSHEARAAQNAQSVLSEQDWLLPQLFDLRVELQKPPLYYWLVALWAGQTGGLVDAWAVRLPAALAGLGTVLAVYWLGWLRGRPLAGFLAAVILATCWHFTWLARVGRIDMPLTFTVTLTVLAFYQGTCKRRDGQGRPAWLWFLLGYLAVAAGLLLKGPIAAVLPAVVLGLSALGETMARPRVPRRPGLHRGWTCGYGLWWGVPLVLLLAGPWYVLATLQTRGDFVRVFFWYHNVERGFGGELHPRPWWFYGPRLLVDLFPWSILLPAAVGLVLRRQPGPRDKEARLGLAWLAGITVLLSLMRFKRADYLLPAYPGAALALACMAERWSQARPLTRRRRRLAATAFAATVASCVLAWAIYTTWIEPGRPAGRPAERFAATIRAQTPGPVIFFRTEDHELAFHVGRPLDSVVEWENLDAWLSRPVRLYVVMPRACAAERGKHLANGSLEEVGRSDDLIDTPVERPLVLLRRLVVP